MLDDLRNHDPVPTEKERAWIDASPVKMAVRFAVLVGISVAIGFAASLSPEKERHLKPGAVLATP